MDVRLHDMIVRKVKPVIVLILIPILFSLMFGWCFSPVYVDDIPTAVLDQDLSEASRDVIERLPSGGGLKIAYFADSQNEIREKMLSGDIQAALIIPEGFGRAVKAGKGAEAVFLINGTNFTISNNAMLAASNIFTQLNGELRVKTLENGEITPYESEQAAGSITVVDRMLFNPQISYLRYIIFGILAILIQQTYLTMLSALLVFTKGRLSDDASAAANIRGVVGNLALTAVIYAGCSAIGLMASLLLLNQIFGIPISGNPLLTLALHAVFILDLTAVALVFGSFFRDEAHCVQLDMFLAIPTMLVCSYAWPTYMMPPFFEPAMKALWPLYYFSIPLRDLNLKGLEIGMVSQYITGGLIYAAVWLPIGSWLYFRSMRETAAGASGIMDTVSAVSEEG